MFKIILSYVIITMFITIFLLYVFLPEPKIIVRYPRVDEELSPLYIDDRNVCYKYKTERIKCP